MTSEQELSNRLMLKARDVMDRSFRDELDVNALAEVAFVSPAHFIRRFKATFGETPHRYLQRRRVERAMFLLRNTETSVTRSVWRLGSPVWGRSVGRSTRSWGSRRRYTGLAARLRQCPAVS